LHPILCLITDRRRFGDGWALATVERVHAAARAGVHLVQVRERDLDGGLLVSLVRACVDAVDGTRARVLVNDRLDVALAVGADGVHLGGGSVPADVARRLLGADALIGVSTHAPGEAPADADLAFFGPVYATPSKGGAQGEARLAEAVRAAAIPVLAIGGVTAARVPAVRAAGAAGAAVIRAILAAPDPAAATGALLAALA